MIWRIDVFSKHSRNCREIVSQIKDLGINKDFTTTSRKVYLLEADLPKDALERVACQLLTDPIVEDFTISEGIFSEIPQDNQVLITLNAGVCDSVALSFDKALRDLELSVKATRTARFYEFKGLSSDDINYLGSKVLFNPLIEHILKYEKVKDLNTLDEFSGKDYKFELISLDILGASDKQLEDISNEGCLSLSLDEMKIIKDYFANLKRKPTDCELETIATLWSEHCAHKTFRGIIEFQEKDSQGKVIAKETINSLLKETIMKATKEIAHKDCVSVFDDNSGVVTFDDKYNICFKVETHNHPSSLEPYGGASTGIGGVIRDILGTGSSARPFASVDIFCFSTWGLAHKDLPPGLLHPKRVIKGVIKGVRDYGNRMGIPTVAGAVCFDERFLGNPLVYCGTLGVLPKEKSFKESEPGELVMLCGAKTGRDGIHGATFSSKELDEDTVGLTSAVQIGNPIEEKKLTEAILRARDKNLFKSITDCGAGGISSAITELSQEHGVRVDLDKVPLKYKGLSYTEIWISESQERMVFFATPRNLKELEEIFAQEDVDLTVVGQVTDDKKLTLVYEGTKVCDLDMDFIFNLPKLKKQAVWVKKEEIDFKLKVQDNYNQDLLEVLGRPNIASKDWILRQYDHEVQSGSVVKSLSGIEELTINDASVVRPDLDSKKSVVIGLGINPFYSDLDPYWMAALSIDEALRNVIACGGKLDKTFILDNFSWGSPQEEETLAALVKAAKSCYDFSTYFGVPFISGKDSLYNEYTVADKRIAIPGTLLISAMSVISDWEKTITGNFKESDNLIYLLGLTKGELGASEYFRAKGIRKGLVPKVDKTIAKQIFENLSLAIEKGYVLACHDLSEGGLAVSIAEMCLGANLGASIFLGEVPKAGELLDYELIFSESASRFIVEVQRSKQKTFEDTLGQIPYGLIGCVSKDKNLVVYGSNNKDIINCPVEQLKESWMKTFDEFR